MVSVATIMTMITTLTGENVFGLRRALNERVEAFINEYGDLALERLDGQDIEPARLQEALQSAPFLSNKKLIVLREPSKQKQFIDDAEHILGQTSESTDVIIVEPKLDKRLGYYKFLKSDTDFQTFPGLDGSALAHWLVGTAKATGGTLSQSDASYIVELVGPNQQHLSQEIEKLTLYNPKISRDTINLLVDPTPQSTVFQLIEAAFSGDIKKALSLYDEQRAMKVEPLNIVALLAWQLHILAIIKAAGDRSVDTIATEAKLSPYVVRKSQSIARQLTLAELKKLIADLLDIDIASKNTNLNIDDALKLYLIKLAHSE
jgi:DNA polymerase-3 subunit delta